MIMSDTSRLEGKTVLIVDDEADVLATVEQLLFMCRITKASSFSKAKELLEAQAFDIAILDIMGVDGYKLLEIANQRKVIAVMLTAHAFSVDDTIRSFNGGAASYLPKEKMSEIVTYLCDILEARDKGKGLWWRWLERLNDYYEKVFGPHWKDKDKEFWEKFRKYYRY
jgi:DNA-binding NtrC family response regulator